MNNVEKFMKLAIKEAKKAYLKDEVPIGCVIVKDGKVVAKAHNTRQKDNLVTSHCELLAIKKLEKKLNDWQLVDCSLFVTLEPCPMCAGAIYQARIKNVYFGAYDLKQGALGSSFNLYDIKSLNFHPFIHGGILEDECKELLQSFFKEKRIKNKEKE